MDRQQEQLQSFQRQSHVSTHLGGSHMLCTRHSAGKTSSFHTSCYQQWTSDWIIDMNGAVDSGRQQSLDLTMDNANKLI